MRFVRGLFERLRVLARRGRFEEDLDDELRFHLEESTRRNGERGMAPDEARIAAQRSFGSVGDTKEQVRKETGVSVALTRLDSWELDLKLGLRMLVKNPGLTFAGGLAMAVGIAISVGCISAVYSLKHSPSLLEGVVAVETFDVTSGQAAGNGAPVRDFVRWRDRLGSVEDLSAFVRLNWRKSITEDGRGDPINSAAVTPSLFRLFPVRPLLGRTLVEADARDGAPPVVVIGERVWRTRFGSDPNVVGGNVLLDGIRHSVVGVMPEDFGYPWNERLWTPLRSDLFESESDRTGVEIVGRLGVDVSLETAKGELEALGMMQSTAMSGSNEERRASLVEYAKQDLSGPSDGFVHAAEIFFALLVLVPFANVAVLVYARTARRQGEIAVRCALGARRIRVVTQLFTEALVLSMVAAAFAIALVSVVFWQINVFLADANSTTVPCWFEFRISISALRYLLLLTVLAATVVGAVPAFQATGRRVNLGLQKSSGGSGMRLGRLWTTLIVGQVTVTVAILPLLAGVSWNASKLGNSGPGLDAEEILTAKLVFGYDPAATAAGAEVADPEPQSSSDFLWYELKRRLEAEPGIAAVTYARDVPGTLPRAGSGAYLRYEAEEATSVSDSSSGFRALKQYENVDLDYFEFFDIPLLTGRLFAPEDRQPESNTVVVDRAFVDAILGNANAVGQLVRVPATRDAEAGPWLEIVGVVEDFPLNESPMQEIRGHVYSAVLPPSRAMALRLEATPAATQVRRIQEIVSAVDPRLGVFDIIPLEGVYRSRTDTRIARTMASVFSVVILSFIFLSAAGIFALSSFAVTMRRREIGIRVALGAHAHRILRSIFSRAALQLSLGIALGTLFAIPIATNFDGGGIWTYLGSIALPNVLFTVAAFVLLVGLVGSLGPAKRGLAVDAMTVLKEE